MNGTTDVLKGRIQEVVGTPTGHDTLGERGTAGLASGQVKQTSKTEAGQWRPQDARTLVDKPLPTEDRKASYQCPVCGNTLPDLAFSPPFDAPCFACHSYLWCRWRNSAAGVVLEAVPGRAPERWEVERVVDYLDRHGQTDRVTLDLSQLEIIYCSFVAALVGMKKRLQVSGRTLSLCGLRPVVREAFDRLRLNMLFDIVKRDINVAVCV